MKKVIFSLCIAMEIIILQGCAVDMYVGKRPSDQNNTKWVSEEPDIYFEVSDKYNELTGCNTYGKVNINGVETEIAVSFALGSPRVEFRPVSAYHKSDNEEESYIDGNAWLFKGNCNFSHNKLVVKIYNNDKGFLDDSIKKITFIKEEKEQE